MKKRKNKEISCHLFQKYSEIRGNHDFSEHIQYDIQNVHNFKFILNELIGSCDIHPNQLFRLLHVFKKDPTYTFSNITENPYRYVRLHLKILSFDKAEEIARAYNLTISNEERIKAWLYDHLLSQCNSLYVEKMNVLRLFMKVFSDVELFSDLTMEIQLGNKTYITIPKLYQLELNIGDILMEHYIQTEWNRSTSSASYLSDYQTKYNITLTSQQTRAVNHALVEKLTVICGLPGTGKSTIAHTICEFHRNDVVYLLAPTGMAVNNLKSKCNTISNEKHVSGTIHKIIYDVFDKKMEKPPRVIIIDEFSMVDTLLFHEICLWCVIFNCKLLLMADHQQLPPIGIGNPLLELIKSPLVKVFRLTKIKRQSNGFLKEMIKRISKNIPVSVSSFDHKSVYFYAYSESNIYSLITTFNLSTSNTQFISPQNRHSSGTFEMSRLLQNIYLPKASRTLLHKSFSRHTEFYVNDFVVRTVNDYTEDCLHANGDVGRLTVGSNPYEVIVNYESGIKQTIDHERLQDEFQLAYCMTVHKVQGSQYDNVVVIIHPEHEFSWTNNESKQLLYTALSRSKQRCFILGSKSLFTEAQKEKNPLSHISKSVFMKQFSNYTISDL